MPVQCNITDTFGATAPAGGYVNESEKDCSVEKFHVVNEIGERVKLRSGKMVTCNVTISGKGAADYGVVACGDFTLDAFKAVSAETTEHNTGEYIDFTINGKSYHNRT